MLCGATPPAQEAELASAQHRAECAVLHFTLAERDAAAAASRQRMMELEVSHAQREALAVALEATAVSAAEAAAEAQEAAAQVMEAQAMAAEAEEAVAVANARADAAEAEAIASAERVKTDVGVSEGVKPVAADAGGGMAGFSPLAAARARATASSQECAQLRDMLTELHGVVRRRGLAALTRISDLEDERDAVEEKADALVETRDELAGQIAGKAGPVSFTSVSSDSVVLSPEGGHFT